MATGYDEDGAVDGLFCVTPPGGGGPTADGGRPPGFDTDPGGTGNYRYMVPTVILSGGSLSYGLAATLPIAIGAGQDLSIEIWAKSFGLGVLDSFDHHGFTGTPLLFWGIRFFHNTAGAGPFVRGNLNRSIAGGGGAAQDGTPVLIENGWHHYCLNTDRSANATLYADGALIDTFNVAPAVGDAYTAFMRLNMTDGATAVNASMVYGPCAIHLRELTLAEIRNSVHKKFVQNLGVNSLGVWRIKDFYGHTGWETRDDFIGSGYRLFGTVPDRPITSIAYGAPEGPTMATVPALVLGPRLPDLSGNGRELQAGTRLAYTAALQASVVFGADPYWR
jgi:hypothetical protein